MQVSFEQLPSLSTKTAHEQHAFWKATKRLGRGTLVSLPDSV
jgi:hypothetical protein